MTTSTSTSVEVIVQSSTIELLQCLGVAVAPIRPASLGVERRSHDLIGVIDFHSPEIVGVLTLAMPDQLTPSFKMPASGSHAMNDWLRELTNQLLGRIKNRLLQYQVSLQVGLPSTMSSALFERQRKQGAPPRVYAFRALRGNVIVTVDATFHNARLVYSGEVPISNEGDLIVL